MDGEQIQVLTTGRPGEPPAALGRTAPPRPKTVLWFVIVTLLLALVLGGLYGFNQFRKQAMTTFFATHKPPPAQISAVTVETTALPRFAPGVGSIAAVHQVTVNPEVGGRVTKIFFEPGQMVHAGDPLVQLNDGPDRGDLANYEAQARLAQVSQERSQSLHHSNFASEQAVDQNQAQLDEARPRS